jgi:hypothetical protein
MKQRVIAYMTLGIDMIPLFPKMVMAASSRDLVIKKVMCTSFFNFIPHTSYLSSSLLTLLSF